MKLTKFTLNAMIMFALAAIVCMCIEVFQIQFNYYAILIIILAPVSIEFLLLGLDIFKTDFKLGNFIIKKDSLRACSICITAGIGGILFANLLLKILPESFAIIGGFLSLSSCICLIVAFITFFQISLSIDEIVAVKFDKLFFYSVLGVSIVTIFIRNYLPLRIGDLSFLVLLFLLPSILLLLKSLREKISFLPNFIMSVSFLVVFVAGILNMFMKLTINIELIIIALIITLVIIAIDQAREIAKSQAIKTQQIVQPTTVLGTEGE